ncbi:hypothetical protein DWU98_03840 [Dyella monticola]|uniref:Uncharacterized protein n=1 Tax=Dyella monticola TaxID=1927958 RepID=A0A370X9M5_9GAMM|nr:hypothetical protein [Dyella monticola]RDS85078.1 hypothetical protein DWU98_03840 [Dyella monticola]
MARSKSLIGLALFCVAAGALAANAPDSAVAVRHSDKQSPTPSVAVNGLGSPVSANTLQHYSGGGLVQNNMNITGTVSNDTTSHVTTGDNTLTGDAFSNAAGLPSVVQNTGNNVLIQTGVIVNVQLKP